MKKIIFLSSLVFALLFVFVACNEEQAVDNNKKVVGVGNPHYSAPPMSFYDSVGLLHNEDVEYVYKILLEKKSEGILTSQDSILHYAHQSGITFFIDSCNIHNDDSVILVNNFDYGWDNTLNNNYSPGKLWFNDGTEDSLTSNQKTYLLALNSIINYDNNLSQLLNDIDNLKAQAESLCDTNEIILLEMVFSVAKSSATYWYNNMDKWIQLSQGMKIKLPFIQYTSVQRAIEADARQGISSRVGSIVLYLAFGFGSGGTAIAFMAARAAAATAIYVILNQ